METQNEKKKVALYCRVSKTDGSQTTDNQKLSLLKYCELNNLEYDIYEEQESTRKTRPIKQNLLTKLRNGEYDTVIVYRLDRWGRSLSELVTEITELRNKNINFISIMENLDFNSAVGMLYFHIVSSFCEYERSLVRERTLQGLERAKNEGKTLGRKKGSKDKVKRSSEGYIHRMQTNPPPNNVKQKIA